MSKCTKIGEAAKRRSIILYEFGRLFRLVEVDSVFFINSVSSICVIITKSSCFIYVDENQWYRLVVDSMVHQTIFEVAPGLSEHHPRVPFGNNCDSCRRRGFSQQLSLLQGTLAVARDSRCRKGVGFSLS